MKEVIKMKNIKWKNVILLASGIYFLASLMFISYQQGINDQNELTNRALKIVHGENIIRIEELEDDILGLEKEIEILTDTLEYYEAQKNK